MALTRPAMRSHASTPAQRWSLERMVTAFPRVGAFAPRITVKGGKGNAITVAVIGPPRLSTTPPLAEASSETRAKGENKRTTEKYLPFLGGLVYGLNMTQAQVSASKTGLLLACTRPFAPDVKQDERDATEKMTYGSATHEGLECLALGELPNYARIAKKWDVKDVSELKKHVQMAWNCLHRWMTSRALKIVGVERPMATRIYKVKGGGLRVQTRFCEFDADTHTYDLKPGEFGGTYDLLLEDKNHNLIVLDTKTGDWGDFCNPGSWPQLLTLGVQANGNVKELAILHTPREGVPVVYSDPVTGDQLAQHAKALKKALARIGDGSLTPGTHCVRCPARSSCPSQDGLLLVRATSLVKAANVALEKSTPSPGAMHMFLAEFKRLAERAHAELKARVVAGDVIQRPDGKVLVLRHKSVEGLSKSSIVKALGKKDGEKMIAKLRKMKCTEVSERDEMWAVDE